MPYRLKINMARMVLLAGVVVALAACASRKPVATQAEGILLAPAPVAPFTLFIIFAERVRPIAMTATAIIAGLLPIMWGHGTGSEVMQRIAAPMVGGMVSVTVLCLLVLPVIYGLILQAQERFRRGAEAEALTEPSGSQTGAEQVSS